MPNPHLPVWFISMLSACATVQVPNIKDCTVRGALTVGGMCNESETGKLTELGRDEYFDFLEPKAATPDASARGGAICQSVDDYILRKNALEELCRLAGDRCTKEVKQAIESMQTMVEFSKQAIP